MVRKLINKANNIRLIVIFLLLIKTIGVFAQDTKPQLAEGLNNYHNLFYTGQKDSVACYRIPTVATAPNGDLVAVIDERVSNCNDLNGNKNRNDKPAVHAKIHTIPNN